MKILLAEDDAKMAEYIVTGLTENGHSVDHVIDGREALSYCLYNDCDLAILDRMMPGMDGLSVLKALRAAKKDLPVIFLTALGQVDDRVEGLAAGGDDYLTYFYPGMIAMLVLFTAIFSAILAASPISIP